MYDLERGERNKFIPKEGGGKLTARASFGMAVAVAMVAKAADRRVWKCIFVRVLGG